MSNNLIKYKLKNIEIHGYHGVLEEEKKYGQKFLITLKYLVEEKDFADDIKQVIDYAKVTSFIQTIFNKKRYNLLETLAQVILKKLLAAYPQITEAEIQIKKPQVDLSAKVDYVAVSLHKKQQ